MSNEITDTAQQIARELREVLARTDWAGEAGRIETEWQEAASPERVNALCAALLQSDPLPTGWDERAMHWRSVDAASARELNAELLAALRLMLADVIFTDTAATDAAHAAIKKAEAAC